MRLLVCWFVLLGCNPSDDDDDDDGTSPSDTDDTDLPPPTGPERWALTLDPALERRTTSADATMVLSGSVLDPTGVGWPDAVAWDVTHADGSTASGTGTVAGNGAWSASATLADGDNTVHVGVTGSLAGLDAAVTYNAGYTFGSAFALDEAIAYVAEPRVLHASVTLTDADTDPLAVTVVRVDGAQETEVATLVDNGDTAAGDALGGDLSYNGTFEVTDPSEGTHQYRVRVGRISGAVALSELRDVRIVQHVDPVRFQQQIAAGADHRQRMEAATSDADKLAVLTLIHDELAADPGVADVGYNDSGRGVWVVYDNGIAAVVPGPTGGKGGARVASGTGFTPLSGALTPELASTCATENSQRALGEPNVIGSAEARVIQAQYWDWGDADDVVDMEQMLLDSGCFGVDTWRNTAMRDGNVEAFRGLDDYGIVLVSTHGDSYFHGVLSLWTQQFGWNGSGGQVIVDSDDLVTEDDLTFYEDDLLLGRLVLWYDTFGVAPGFVDTFSSRMPNSFVYMSTCRGGLDATMAAAFLENGAGTYLGYTDYVEVAFTREVGTPVFESLLDDPDTTVGEAFTPGITETDDDPATFVLFGSTDLQVGSGNTLQDGGFEDGDLVGWDPRATAAAISQFGDTQPTQGNLMAYIAGFMPGEMIPGEFSQRICLDEATSTLSFDWNLFTDEVTNWEVLGFPFGTSLFLVTVEASDGSHLATLFFTSMEDLADELEYAEDIHMGGCSNCTEATGWNSESVTLPESVRGQTVYLTFQFEYNFMIGGANAVLVDDVRLSP